MPIVVPRWSRGGQPPYFSPVAILRSHAAERGMLSVAISRSNTRDAHRDDAGLRLMAGRL
jgi:hypothetical protein